ncbi:MAG: hypothetical protein V2A55_03120 [Candidatus Jorgensenbacteria bacterium]
MKIRKEWKNWQVFWVSVVLALVFTFLIEPLYDRLFAVGGGLGSFVFPSYFDTYPPTFFLLYTLFITFFYKAFSQSFKPTTLIYFVIAPLLLFLSSLTHLATFLALLVVSLLSAIQVKKLLR